MTAIEILRSARELISDPDKWCQGSFARTEPDENGIPIGTFKAGATCWCAIGALRRAAGIDWETSDGYAVAGAALNDACNAPVGLFNDTHTHAEVLAMFDKAIVKLEQQPV